MKISQNPFYLLNRQNFLMKGSRNTFQLPITKETKNYVIYNNYKDQIRIKQC